MEFVEFLFLAANLPFTAALLLVLLLAAVELLLLLFGLLSSELLDTLLPDLDTPSPVAQLLSWLHVGKLPLTVLLILLLTGFGLTGLTLQAFALHLLGAPLSPALALPAALAVSLPAVHAAGRLVAQILPTEESSAVSEASLIGQVAVVTLGTARRGNPAEARLVDEHGTLHYLLVEPLEEGEAFPTGTRVVVVKREGAIFKAIRLEGE